MKKRYFLLPFLSLVITSCSLFPLQYVPYTSLVRDIDDYATFEGDNYYKPSAYTDDYTTEFRSHRWENERTINLRSTGTQKILVIPVEFSDVPASELTGGAEGSRTIIQNTFFGASNRTQWESVASYFNKSSYGKMIVDGTVSSWYPSGYTATQALAEAGASSKTAVSEKILQAAVRWYKLNYDDITSFDQDEDGYIDSVYLIYSAPYQNSDSLFWAYTSFDTGNKGSEHLEDPITNAYAWASFSFLNVYDNRPDAHTIIHEVGHLLGLADYYNTSSVEGATSSETPLPVENPEEYYQYTNGPTGKVDMMDYSVGDQTIYSKMALNWTRPYVVTGSTSISVQPFSWYGDAILLAPDWNGSAMDEYLALEFYAPTKLNYRDAQSAYGSAQLMTDYGIKVYHVDARLGYYRTDNSNLFLGYVDTTDPSTFDSSVYTNHTYYQKIAHTNTYSTSQDGKMLYHLLESSGRNSFLTGAMASNATLFKLGDSFGVNTFTDFTFHDGKTLGYTFTITSLSRTWATITFTETTD